MDQYPPIDEDGLRLVEGQPASCCRRQQSEEGGNFPFSRYPSSGTPRNFKYLQDRDERLLVAKHETGRGTICQGLRSMSSQQSKHQAPKTRHDSHHPRAPPPVSNSGNGLYHQPAKIREVQYRPYHHRSQLQQSSYFYPLSRSHHGRRSSWAIPATRIPAVWGPQEDHLR